jgi:hypothetical protein
MSELKNKIANRSANQVHEVVPEKKTASPPSVTISKPATAAPPRLPPRSAASFPKATALYDYAATTAQELSFQSGDVITIKDQSDEVWHWGELNGQEGYVPKNYVQLS